jgi:hypothetical protein
MPASQPCDARCCSPNSIGSASSGVAKKAEHRDYADDLDDLLIAPMLAKLREHRVGFGCKSAHGIARRKLIASR